MLVPGARWWWVLAVVVFLVASPAQARPARRSHAAAQRIGVVPFQGRSAKLIEKAATRVLVQHHLKVTRVSDGPAPDDSPGEDASARNAAIRTSVVGLISAAVVADKKTATVTIFLRDGEDGAVVQQKAWSSKKGPRLLVRAVTKGVWPAFKTAIGALHAPSPSKKEPSETPPEAPIAATPAAPTPPAPAPSEPSEPSAAPAPSRRSEAAASAEAPGEPEEPSAATGPSGPSTLALAVGPRMMTRSFSYRNVPVMPLNEFTTHRPSSALGVGVTWFPRLARPRLGVELDGQFGARVRATTSDSSTYELHGDEVMGTALVGVGNSWVAADLGVGGGLQRSHIIIIDAPTQTAPLPDVDYGFLRAGADLHFYTRSPVGVVVGAHYRHVLSTGNIGSADWFPKLTAYGLDAMIGISYRLLPWLEARLQGDNRYYRFHMHSDAADAHVAGGAVDEYWGGMLSLAGLLGGTR
jgi:hypothetical protein